MAPCALACARQPQERPAQPGPGRAGIFDGVLCAEPVSLLVADALAAQPGQCRRRRFHFSCSCPPTPRESKRLQVGPAAAALLQRGGLRRGVRGRVAAGGPLRIGRPGHGGAGKRPRVCARRGCCRHALEQARPNRCCLGAGGQATCSRRDSLWATDGGVDETGRRQGRRPQSCASAPASGRHGGVCLEPVPPLSRPGKRHCSSPGGEGKEARCRSAWRSDSAASRSEGG